MSSPVFRRTASLLLLGLDGARAVQAPGATLDGVVGTLALHAVLLLAAWWSLAGVALGLARLPGAAGAVAGRVADAVTPTLLRRLAAAVTGAAVAAAPAAPALALVSDTTAPPTAVPAAALASAGTARLLDHLPDADWPARETSAEQRAPGGPAGAPAATRVVVRAGDTLWDIAARHLGSRATPDEVAREWPRWWHANAAVVGHDPDLLRPGQVLTAPAPAPAR